MRRFPARAIEAEFDPPYTKNVGSSRKLVLLALGAVIVCVPGLLRASESPDFVYRIRLANPDARVEWSASHTGPISQNWEVTVAVDRQACEVSCSYRLKRSSGLHVQMLAPPKVVVQVYSDGVSLPQTVSIDPGGLDIPALTRRALESRDKLYMPVRKLFPGVPGEHVHFDAPVILQASFSSVDRPPVFPVLSVPLRI